MVFKDVVHDNNYVGVQAKGYGHTRKLKPVCIVPFFFIVVSSDMSTRL